MDGSGYGCERALKARIMVFDAQRAASCSKGGVPLMHYVLFIGAFAGPRLIPLFADVLFCPRSYALVVLFCSFSPPGLIEPVVAPIPRVGLASLWPVCPDGSAFTAAPAEWDWFVRPLRSRTLLGGWGAPPPQQKTGPPLAHKPGRQRPRPRSTDLSRRRQRWNPARAADRLIGSPVDGAGPPGPAELSLGCRNDHSPTMTAAARIADAFAAAVAKPEAPTRPRGRRGRRAAFWPWRGGPWPDLAPLGSGTARGLAALRRAWPCAWRRALFRAIRQRGAWMAWAPTSLGKVAARTSSPPIACAGGLRKPFGLPSCLAHRRRVFASALAMGEPPKPAGQKRELSSWPAWARWCRKCGEKCCNAAQSRLKQRASRILNVCEISARWRASSWPPTRCLPTVAAPGALFVFGRPTPCPTWPLGCRNPWPWPKAARPRKRR